MGGGGGSKPVLNFFKRETLNKPKKILLGNYTSQFIRKRKKKAIGQTKKKSDRANTSLMSSYDHDDNVNPFFFPEVVLVLGKTGVGKSTFIKAATGLDVKVEDGLHSGSFPFPPFFFVPSPQLHFLRKCSLK